MTTLNEAKMPSLKDKIEAEEQARILAEKEAKAEKEKPKKKLSAKK